MVGKAGAGSKLIGEFLNGFVPAVAGAAKKRQGLTYVVGTEASGKGRVAQYLLGDSVTDAVLQPAIYPVVHGDYCVLPEFDDSRNSFDAFNLFVTQFISESINGFVVVFSAEELLELQNLKIADAEKLAAQFSRVFAGGANYPIENNIVFVVDASSLKRAHAPEKIKERLLTVLTNFEEHLLDSDFEGYLQRRRNWIDTPPMGAARRLMRPHFREMATDPKFLEKMQQKEALLRFTDAICSNSKQIHVFTGADMSNPGLRQQIEEHLRQQSPVSQRLFAFPVLEGNRLSFLDSVEAHIREKGKSLKMLQDNADCVVENAGNQRDREWLQARIDAWHEKNTQAQKEVGTLEAEVFLQYAELEDGKWGFNPWAEAVMKPFEHEAYTRLGYRCNPGEYCGTDRYKFTPIRQCGWRAWNATEVAAGVNECSAYFPERVDSKVPFSNFVPGEPAGMFWGERRYLSADQEERYQELLQEIVTRNQQIDEWTSWLELSDNELRGQLQLIDVANDASACRAAQQKLVSGCSDLQETYHQSVALEAVLSAVATSPGLSPLEGGRFLETAATSFRAAYEGACPSAQAVSVTSVGDTVAAGSGFFVAADNGNSIISHTDTVDALMLFLCVARRTSCVPAIFMSALSHMASAVSAATHTLASTGMFARGGESGVVSNEPSVRLS